MRPALTRRASSDVLVRVAAVLALFVVAASPLRAQGAIDGVTNPLSALQPKSPDSKTHPAASTTGGTIPDVVVAAARGDAMRREILDSLEGPQVGKQAAAVLAEAQAQVPVVVRSLATDALRKMRYDELVDIDTGIRERVRPIESATQALGRIVGQL